MSGNVLVASSFKNHSFEEMWVSTLSLLVSVVSAEKSVVRKIGIELYVVSFLSQLS